MNTEETVEFSNKELQQKYEYAKFISQDHIKKMDSIGVDIRRAEAFLLKSGFGEFEKAYKPNANYSTTLVWDSKRLTVYSGKPLGETNVKTRLEMYPFLGDFLESIALFYSQLGEKK